MRWWCVVLLAVGCDSAKKAVPQSGGSAQSGTPAVPADAQPADSPVAVAPDAAVPDAPSGPVPVDTDKILDVEAIGPLRIGMREDEAIKILHGAPMKKTPTVEEGATGEFYSEWSWKGVKLDMVSETRQGATRIRLIHITAPTTFATARGIKIGDSHAKVAATYPKSDEGSDDPTQFLVGSPYGGLLFVLKDQKTVSEIVLGAMAF